MTLDAAVAYDVWLRLIADEELYRQTLAGTYRTYARELTEEQMRALDGFHAEPGLRWNIENLRFRTALEAGSTLASYLPRTIKMLTKGDDNWLQDIVFEYLASHRWQEFGQHRFAECNRFVAYIKDRIVKRRITPPHFDVVVDFEHAIVQLLQATGTAPAAAWTSARELPDDALVAATLTRGPAVAVIELPVDIRPWIESVDPTKGDVHERAVTLLAYVPSLTETHRIKAIGDGARIVLEAFDGRAPTQDVVARLAAAYDLDRDDVLGLVRPWLRDGVLAVVASPG